MKARSIEQLRAEGKLPGAPELREVGPVPVPVDGTVGGRRDRMQNARSYQWRKIFGSVKSNGNFKLRSLTARHKQIIARHLEGWKAEAIANEIGCSIGKVYRVLKDPLARELVDNWQRGIDMELEALSSKAVDSLRHALVNGSVAEQLGAVDRIFKSQGRYKESTTPAVGGEDVIARMLGFMTTHMELRPVGRRPIQFLDLPPLERGERSEPDSGPTSKEST